MVTTGMRLTAAVTKEGSQYVARCLDVEVTSQGRSFEEALENLAEALGLFFQDEGKRPDGLPPIIASVEVSV